MKTYPCIVAAACLAACTSLDVAEPPEVSAQNVGTIPVGFRGTWTPNRSGRPGGERATRIGATTWEGHESYGEVRSVRVHGPTEITATVGFSGEGERWVDTLHLRLTAEGNEMIVDRDESTSILYRLR